MRQLVLIVVLSLFIYQLSTARIFIRTKRQVEREGNYQNESTVIVNGDRDIEQIEPTINNADTDVMEVDFDPNEGSVHFGGKFPAFPFFPNRDFHNNLFHNNMQNAFRQMAQHFEEMARSMFERFNNTGSQYPANYNGTKEEIITVEGKQYIKKEHVIKKSDNNVNIFITSTTYEPIDDKKNES